MGKGSWRAHKRFMEGARRLMEGSQKVHGRCAKAHGWLTKGSWKVHEGPWRAHKRFMEGARRFMEFSRRVHGRLTKVHEEFTIQCGLNESYADQLRKFIFAHTNVLRRIVLTYTNHCFY